MAGDPGRVRLQRRVLEQRAYIARLTARARLAEQLAERHAEAHGTWLNAHQAWLDVALDMRGYVPHADTFAAYERAQVAAWRGKSRLAGAETLWRIANWANIIGDQTHAAAAVEVGVALLDGLDDKPVQRLRGRLLYELGRVHRERKELDAALRTLKQARVLNEWHGTPYELATILYELGRLHHVRKEPDEVLDEQGAADEEE